MDLNSSDLNAVKLDSRRALLAAMQRLGGVLGVDGKGDRGALREGYKGDGERFSGGEGGCAWYGGGGADEIPGPIWGVIFTNADHLHFSLSLLLPT